jgi:hypothetical protein
MSEASSSIFIDIASDRVAFGLAQDEYKAWTPVPVALTGRVRAV